MGERGCVKWVARCEAVRSGVALHAQQGAVGGEGGARGAAPRAAAGQGVAAAGGGRASLGRCSRPRVRRHQAIGGPAAGAAGGGGAWGDGGREYWAAAAAGGAALGRAAAARGIQPSQVGGPAGTRPGRCDKRLGLHETSLGMCARAHQLGRAAVAIGGDTHQVRNRVGRGEGAWGCRHAGGGASAAPCAWAVPAEGFGLSLPGGGSLTHTKSIGNRRVP
jgi:hypothetical protein